MSVNSQRTKHTLAISPAAHQHLTKYAALLAKQLGLSNVTLFDAANKLICSTPLPTNGHNHQEEAKPGGN